MTNKYTKVEINIGWNDPIAFDDADGKNAGATAAAQLLAGQDIDAVTFISDAETEVIIPYHAILEGIITLTASEEIAELSDDLCDGGDIATR